MQEYWTILTRLGRRLLWHWRNERVWRGITTNWHKRRATIEREVAAALYHQQGHESRGHRRTFQAIEHWLHEEHTPEPTRQAHQEHRLFFDGGTRLEPHRSGSGALLQQLSTRGWHTVWCASVSIGPTTNNLAEYVGLLTGLQQIQPLGITDLTIIGDSQLVLRQMTGHYRVKTKHLRKLHQETQLHLAQLNNVQFQHTRRDHNTAADRLANMAMELQETRINTWTTEGTDNNHPPWIPPDFHELTDHDDQYQVTAT